LVLGVAGLLLAVLALALGGLLWQRLSAAQEELARRSLESSNTATESRTVAAQAEAQVQELQARLSVAEVKLSEVSLQRSQLEELMLSVSRSRDDNLVQDLESAIRLAAQQAQVTGSVQPLISALQAADQRIGRAAQPRLNPVQRAIARDIERIRGASLADIPALAALLDELARQVDLWPTLNQVGPQAVATQPKPAAGPVPAPSDRSADSATDASADAPPAGAWAQVKTWWLRIASEVVHSGRDLVRVSRIDRPEAALLAPEQTFFLRENLKLKLLNARLGVLARQLRIAQADLVAVDSALERYFDPKASSVAGARAAMLRLKRDLVDSPMPTPDDSLAALAAAAGGR
jgi:uroporphyrin-3 C-methyltransferase